MAHRQLVKRIGVTGSLLALQHYHLQTLPHDTYFLHLFTIELTTILLVDVWLCSIL